METRKDATNLKLMRFGTKKRKVTESDRVGILIPCHRCAVLSTVPMTSGNGREDMAIVIVLQQNTTLRAKSKQYILVFGASINCLEVAKSNGAMQSDVRFPENEFLIDAS
ncbi:hypothetical protein LOAG_04912 [Loa loa]|uniref:Uncharacterized protein n=1 Tax=Loa loa TaxID=7209 RepID=A0A1S0U2T2_LOALO|nr:hypothetical protein LOAG_04912 [Loa loa]EFO23571.1 hypothetical protein LOAG_04912 [Loa loa]